MSRGSGDAAASQQQPREWFTVLFGSRVLHGQQSYVDHFTDAVKAICVEEGVLLTERPFRRTIIEDDSVETLLEDLEETMKRLRRKHGEATHFPLILLIDDQTLYEVYDDHVEPAFSNEAFIYALKGSRVKEFIATELWEQVREDIRAQKEIWDEFNPLLVPLRVDTRSYRDRDDAAYDSPRQAAPQVDRYADRNRPMSPPPRPTPPIDRYADRNRPMNPPSRPTPPIDRYDDNNRHRVVEEPVREMVKLAMTPDAVEGALRNVAFDPKLLELLAEDMDQHMDLARLVRDPLSNRPAEHLNLLELLLLSAENRPAGQTGAARAEGTALRKTITRIVLKSGLLKAVRDNFLAGLHDRLVRDDIGDDELTQVARAIKLLLRGFILLSSNDMIDDDSLALWNLVESPAFRLPGRFWHFIGNAQTEELCKLASKVTTGDKEVYMDSVRQAIEADHRPARRADPAPNQNGRHVDERRRRRDPDGAAPSSSAYKYDPYNVDDDDESDTTEAYGRREAVVGREESSGISTPREEDIVEEGGFDGYRETEEERAMREEEERRRQMELEAEAAEQQRQYERRRHNIALQQAERRKWEESNELCIAWRDNDAMPDVSYRKLANRPVYADLYQPKQPYIRRALTSGAYTDNEHYLDVQFRLMREDMVATLRDGIYSQKILTDPGMLIKSSNDIKIYPTIEVGALQVRSIDGAPMRVVNIPQHMLQQIREERQLKFGQCVVMSSDKFDREFHIGWICDRFQEPGQPWQGRLAISFFDECAQAPGSGMRPIDKTTTYALAESSSAYLEAYIHVLRVMKKMKRNVVFPLERYLVHMKKNTRLPQYMRSREKDEDREEDKERVQMYDKKRREADAKEKEKERKKKQRSNSREEGNGTSEEHVTTEEGVSEENLGDEDGFNTDEEDSFLTGGRHTHPNPRDLETISIQGKAYHVERLEEEFKTDVLDETQRKAMCYALTSELAIVQGPPGTGKTHIGVEIVMAILENRIKWRMTEPILIVTFSNQALDHFLDKIRVQIELRGLANEEAPPVVRLGSRSEHDSIKLNCLLATVMKDYEEDLAGDAFGERNRARKTKQAVLERLVRAVKTVQISRKSIMEYDTLRQVINADHDMQFRQAAYGLRDSNGHPLNMDEVLVAWLLNKSYEKKRDLPPGSDDDSEEERMGAVFGGVASATQQRKPVVPKPHKKGGRKETKKEKNERKRSEKRHQWHEESDSSDTEDEDESPQSDVGPNETNYCEDGEMDEDQSTDAILAMLAKLNADATKEQSSAANEEKWRRMAEKYEMDEDWEVEREYAARNNGRMLVNDVDIFSRTTKSGFMKGRGGGKERQQVCVDPNIVKDIQDHKQYILSKEAMSNEELSRVINVRTLPKEARWRLLVRWQENLAKVMRNQLDAYAASYERACVVAEEKADISRAAVLKKALIVGATTTGSAKRRGLISRIAPKVLVVEEAAEVLEAHLLASIVHSVQHAIFIGDHQQLRPSTAVHTLAKMANMEVSLFERLVKNGYPYHTLGLQHRMLEPLTKYVVKPYFYRMLQDAPSVKSYPDVTGMATNLFFWAHNVPEDTVADSMSKKNIVEAEMCRSIANYILMQGQYRASEITIIGMYGAQVQEIKRLMQGYGGALSDVAVETVDSYQGKENRVMILSLVRSHSGGVGFLAIPNRITVALTRAQHGMYVVGNFADIAHYSDLWENIVGSLNNVGLIDYGLPLVCQRHGNHTKVSTNDQFQQRVPWGGCTELCGYRMPCEHLCKQTCHPPWQHERPTGEGPSLECRETCVKRCHKCDARCTKKCQEPCGTCHAIVTLDLDCGHKVRCECGARNLARCKEPCTEVLECGHTCQNKCSVECVTVERCEKGVHFVHPRCHHELVLPCNQVRPYNFGISEETPACYEKCPERLVCGHKCPLNCGEICPSTCDVIVHFEGACGHRLQKKCSEDQRHIKCTALVDSQMPHCSHRIKMECYQSRNQNECRSSCGTPTSCGHECSLSCGECYRRASAHECAARCTRDLACGHRCQGRCGKPCVCLSSCRVRCSHQRCGPLTKDKGGAQAHGRTCSQPCVQCVDKCDNHCEHKGCSKKCFEVCDVREPCSEPCRKVLRCNHSCLGLCGEPCPSMCGTCSITQYKALIQQYPDETASGELSRLIQMPGCDHIFPYKFVDKHVREQVAAGCIVLKCPRCRGMIEDCKRYIKTTKQLWASADSRKWEKAMADLDMSRAELMQKYGQMRALMTTRQDDVARYYKVVAAATLNQRESFALDTFRVLELLFQELRGTLAVVDSRTEFFYWQAVVSCHQSICALVLDYLQKSELLKIDMVNDAQPNLKGVMEEAFERRRSRFFPMKDQFRTMTAVVRESMEYRRVGQLVPAFRAAMTKSALYYHMEHLNASLRGKRDDQGEMVDLTLAQMGAYKRVIRMILNDVPAEQPHKKLEDMMAKIHSDVYAKLLRTEYVSPKVFKVALPEF